MMEETSGINPSSSGPNPQSEHSHGPVDSKKFSEAMSDTSIQSNQSSSSGGQVPQSFVQQVWGFTDAETKKFLSNLANTIIAQIKHEDQRAKETADKLKEAEQGEDQ